MCVKGVCVQFVLDGHSLCVLCDDMYMSTYVHTCMYVGAYVRRSKGFPLTVSITYSF